MGDSMLMRTNFYNDFFGIASDLIFGFVARCSYQGTCDDRYIVYSVSYVTK